MDILSEKNKSVDLNSYSLKFISFVLLINAASQKDLVYLIKHNPNPVIKSYAYIGLVMKDNNECDNLMKKYYKRITIKIADEEDVCDTSDVFIRSIHKMKYRLQSSINGSTRSINERENKVIQNEDKIKQEQK